LVGCALRTKNPAQSRKQRNMKSNLIRASLACHSSRGRNRRSQSRPGFLAGVVLGLLALPAYPVTAEENQAEQPQHAGIGPNELAVIINDLDPLSRKIGNYYQKKRQIPQVNMIHVRFKPGGSNLPRAEFIQIKTDVDRQTQSNVQTYALTWAAPYRVDCMSITTAFATGFDAAYCSTTCGSTKFSRYFNSASRAPYSDLKIRPTMTIAAINFSEAKRLIDRGVAADNTFPKGAGYLVIAPDKARSVRSVLYNDIVNLLGKLTDLRIIRTDYLVNQKNIMFYFTGSAHVQKLDSNRFLPGAMADHLTSTGGLLTDSTQMSSLRWLEAGATGSYGTVVEPCNHLAKFPHPGVAINWYLQGDTLIEAYWKSVAWPGEGIFIGEPLARPYAYSNYTQLLSN
jgi:uncharacterized protein (TIGR03790 family)